MPEKRFKVVYENLDQYNDPEGYTDGFEYNEYAGYLVDTATNTIVFCDATEPEDASLSRTFGPLVDLLNAFSTTS